MSGKLCDGQTDTQPYVLNSRAYCEGVYARSQSSSPTNPHDSTANPVAAADWDRGVAYCATLVGQTLDRDNMACCQAGIGTTVPI